MPGRLPTSRSAGHHLYPALRPGLPWTQLLPGMSLSQRWPLQPADGAVHLCSWLHGGEVSGIGRAGAGAEGARGREGGRGQAHSAGRPGAERSAPWATSDRTVRRHATAPPAPAASPTARACASTASPGTAAPSASAPMASTASAASCPAPATPRTASGGPGDLLEDAGGPGWARPSALKPPGSYPRAGWVSPKGTGGPGDGQQRGALGTAPSLP